MSATLDNDMILSDEYCVFLQEDLTKLKDIDNSLAIFVMATYGEGDPTDNAQEFYDWLKDSGVELPGLRFAVSYHNYLFEA